MNDGNEAVALLARLMPVPDYGKVLAGLSLALRNAYRKGYRDGQAASSAPTTEPVR